MVYNEDLDAEIKKAQNRLYYLQDRKRRGNPPGCTGTYTSRTKIKRPRKKEDELHVFYRTQITNGSFKKEYDNLKENMIKHSRTFAAYHNQVFNAINKYGTKEDKDKFSEICNINDLEINM